MRQLLLLCLCALPAQVQAQVYQCNGTWTTTPCSDKGQPVKLRELSRTKAPSAQQAPQAPAAGEAPAEHVGGGDAGTSLTRLRPLGPPVWQIEERDGGRAVTWAQVRVKNFGEHPAMGVEVLFESAGKRRKATGKMKGPGLLEKHATGEYELESPLDVEPESRFTVRALCKNCRK